MQRSKLLRRVSSSFCKQNTTAHSIHKVEYRYIQWAKLQNWRFIATVKAADERNKTHVTGKGKPWLKVKASFWALSALPNMKIKLSSSWATEAKEVKSSECQKATSTYSEEVFQHLWYNSDCLWVWLRNLAGDNCQAAFASTCCVCIGSMWLINDTGTRCGFCHCLHNRGCSSFLHGFPLCKLREHRTKRQKDKEASSEKSQQQLCRSAHHTNSTDIILISFLFIDFW